MRFASFTGAVLAAASAVTAVAVGSASPANSVIEARQRVPNEGDARARCEKRGPQDGEHVLVIIWSQYGTIGGDGDPAIGDSGAFYMFSHNCNNLGSSSWSGARGDYTIDFEGDHTLSFSISGGALENHPPGTPQSPQVDNNDMTYFDCVREANSGFGYASHYRTCSMRW